MEMFLDEGCIRENSCPDQSMCSPHAALTISQNEHDRSDPADGRLAMRQRYTLTLQRP